MLDKLTGREEEQLLLEALFNSEKSEFLAIYGRRRVGKTILIRSFFEKKKAIFFCASGTLKGKLSKQVSNFTQQIAETFYQGASLNVGKNWDAAFQMLTDAIKQAPENKKIVLFLDEFPWMATKNSKLLQTLDYYWNQYWSWDKRIKLIICGSSASWIINNIINNKGGLHNRTTRTIHLEPFNLRDTKRFLNHQGIRLNHRQITELYMVTGGIPYYLSQIEKGLSATQNIEKLAFQRKSFFLNEFDNLFSSLFNEAEIYIQIVQVIAAHRYGIAQEELFNKINKFSKGGRTKKRLKSLEDTGFIISFKPHLNQRKGIYYKIIDEYTLFYFAWIEPIRETLLSRGLKKGYWEHMQNTPAWYSWVGYAFEAVCYKHLVQISDALHMSPVAIPNSWRYSPAKNQQEKGAQIDLLFDRQDDSITLCEIKYSNQPFLIDKQYAHNISNKIKIFEKITKTQKNIFFSMIAANGLKKSIYSEELISSVVTLDDLFK